MSEITHSTLKIIDETILCKYCNNIFEKPVFLTCCSESLCEKHIEEISDQHETKTFFCFNCNTQNFSNYFPPNKLIKKLLECQLDKLNFGEEYEIAKNKCKDLQSLVIEFKVLTGNSETYIKKHFQNMADRLLKTDSRVDDEIYGIFKLYSGKTLDNRNACLANCRKVIKSSEFIERVNLLKREFDVKDVYSKLELFNNNKAKFNSYWSSACLQINQINNIAKDFKREIVNDKHCNVKGLIDLTELKNEFSKKFNLVPK